MSAGSKHYTKSEKLYIGVFHKEKARIQTGALPAVQWSVFAFFIVFGALWEGLLIAVDLLLLLFKSSPRNEKHASKRHSSMQW
jgi:hypothetical protein